MSSFRGRWNSHVELLAAYLDEKAKNVDSIHAVDCGIALQLTAFCRSDVRQNVKNSWIPFPGWSVDKPDAAARITQFFPSEKKALYVSFVSQDSLFSQTLQYFERMKVMVCNMTIPVSNVSPAIAETHQIFEKPASGVDRQ